MTERPQSGEYLKIGEAAEFLGVNRRTVYRWIWSGKLPASKVGGLYYIRRADLEALLSPGKAMAPRLSAVPQGTVSGPLARLRERIFIRQVQERVEQVETLIHPTGGAVLTLRAEDWAAARRAGDDRLAVMRGLGKMALDAETAAAYPLNAWLRWEIAGDRPLRLEARALNRLEVYLKAGYDARPLGKEALLAALGEAGPQQGIVVLFSATGWAQPARAAVQQSEFPGHPHTLLYLLDGVDEKLVYNEQNERLRGYADLFSPPPMEALHPVLVALRQAAAEHSPYPLQQAEENLPYSILLLWRAFERLAASGEFDLQVLPGQGLALVGR